LITPPHIAAACLVAVSAEELYISSEHNSIITLYASVILINLVIHYILDIVPHGHTVNPFDMGDKLGGLYIELAVSAVIVLMTIFLTDFPVLVIISSVSSLIPDCVSTSLAKLNLPSPIKKILTNIQRFHFYIHWFEKRDEKGKRIVPLPSKFELILQGIFVILCIIMIFLIKLK
jgi:hypothetical protein